MLSAMPRLIIIAAICGFCGSKGMAQVNLDRMASFAWDLASGQQEMVLTDTESFVHRRFLLPAGSQVGKLICVDSDGDVWFDYKIDMGRLGPPYVLERRSALDGSLLARWFTNRQPTYIGALPGGSVIVGLVEPPTSSAPGLYIVELAGSGFVLRELNLANLFPPGGLRSFYGVIGAARAGPGIPAIDDYREGIVRIIVHSDLSIWIHAPQSIYHTVIVLEYDWTLRFSVPILDASLMIPLGDRGVAVAHRDDAGTRYTFSLFPLPPRIDPNAPPIGFYEILNSGQLGRAGLQMAFNFYDPFVQGLTTSDGRGVVGGGNLRDFFEVAQAWMFSPAISSIPPIVTGSYSGSYGLHLDGRQRAWKLASAAAPQVTPRDGELVWYRLDVASNAATTQERIYVGPSFLPNGNGSYILSGVNCAYGHASLHEYVLWTDPYGDIDADGFPNIVELQNGSNPLRAVELSSRVSVSTGIDRTGTRFDLVWWSPADAGRPYVAPLALQPLLTSLGNGHYVPVDPADPLVALTLSAGAPLFEGFVGQLDAAGQARASIPLPLAAAYSGTRLYGCLLSFQDLATLRLRTVSQAIPIVLP